MLNNVFIVWYTSASHTESRHDKCKRHTPLVHLRASINKCRSWRVIFVQDQAFVHMRSKTIKVACVNIHKKTFYCSCCLSKSWVNLLISVGFSSPLSSANQRSAHTDQPQQRFNQRCGWKRVRNTCKWCQITSDMVLKWDQKPVLNNADDVDALKGTVVLQY